MRFTPALIRRAWRFAHHAAQRYGQSPRACFQASLQLAMIEEERRREARARLNARLARGAYEQARAKTAALDAQIDAAEAALDAARAELRRIKDPGAGEMGIEAAGGLLPGPFGPADMRTGPERKTKHLCSSSEAVARHKVTRTTEVSAPLSLLAVTATPSIEVTAPATAKAREPKRTVTERTTTGSGAYERRLVARNFSRKAALELARRDCARATEETVEPLRRRAAERYRERVAAAHAAVTAAQKRLTRLQWRRAALESELARLAALMHAVAVPLPVPQPAPAQPLPIAA